MRRYIDAEDLKAVIQANDWSNPVVPDVVGIIIDRTPTADVVEVVRCKDCKNYKAVADFCGNCYKTTYVMNPDDYCSRGERREK